MCQHILAPSNRGLLFILWFQIKQKDFFSRRSCCLLQLFLWLLPSVAGVELVYRDSRLYSRKLTTLPSQIDHSVTEYFVYLGSEDPFCYDELVYDTWWFASHQESDHCLKEMNSQNCLPVSYVLETTKMEFLQSINTVRCLGVKGTSTQIKSEQNNWFKVYTIRGYRNYFGEIYFVKIQDLILFLSPPFKKFMLLFDGKTVVNHQLKDSHRKFLPHRYFNYMNTTKNKLHEIGVIDENSPWHLSQNDDFFFDCNLILYTSFSSVNMGVDYYGNTFFNDSHVFTDPIQMTCLEDFLCICPTIELSSLLLDTIETPYVVDTTSTWYSKLFDFLVSKLFEIFKSLSKSLFGPNWQVSALVLLISNLFLQRFFTNPYVTLATSFLVMIWLMDF